jgi:two-component system cell cycle sensor histidine kinase/response regulator CckA
MADFGELDRLATENAELRHRLHELERSAAAAIDISEHKCLRDTAEKLRVAIRATGLGLWSFDVARRRLTWDERTCALHGLDATPTLERYVQQIVHPTDRSDVLARTRRSLKTGRWDSVRYRIVRPDGAVRWMLTSGGTVCSVDGTPCELVGGMLDVTEQRTLEDQLRQAQKMEAIGNLSAGIAHNFNNMLAVIMPSLEVAVGHLPVERKPLLREAAHAARRASELVRQLMTFAGQSPSSQRAQHSSHEIVEAAVGICARAFGVDLQLETVFECAPVTLSCNAGQLEQVLVNLLLNARDAVRAAERGSGRVSVRVSLRSGGDEPRVCIQVSDDGVGMSEEVRARAFEPFFTTKGVGRGTGLGLATSYAIVRDHLGTLECSSGLGRGTTFTMTLPCARALAGGLSVAELRTLRGLDPAQLRELQRAGE